MYHIYFEAVKVSSSEASEIICDELFRDTPEARDGGWEDQPHVQGAVAVRAQEGLEELSHVEGQEGWQWGDTPRPR